MKKTPNRLNRQQFYQLTEALKANAAEFLAETPPLSAAAKRLSNELGFPISYEQVAEAQELTGVTWTSSVREGCKERESVKRKLEALSLRVAELEGDQPQVSNAALAADLAVLRGLVHHLYHQLDCQPPAGYVLPTDPTKRRVVG